MGTRLDNLRHAARTRRGGNLAGKDVLFDIDWRCAATVRKKCRVMSFACSCCRPETCPRGTAKPAHDRRKRWRGMAAASAEISHWPEYDYVIVNSDLETINSALAILTERLNAPAFLAFGVRARYVGCFKQPFDHRDRRCPPASQILQSSALQPVAQALFPLLAAEAPAQRSIA